MKLYLVRHGETDYNKARIIQGRLINENINNIGIMQANELKNKIKDVKFNMCYTSPLIRAWSTAMIIVGDKVEIRKDDRIIERYLGDLEGKNRLEYDLTKYWDYDLNSNEYNVETIKDMLNRCESFINTLKENYDEEDNILIVTHNAVIKALLNILKNKDYPNNMELYHVGNCFVECVEVA